ncbi:MAG: TIM barrel protein [Spirosomataceae bacterium]
MNRRQFIQNTSLGLAAINLSTTFANTPMGVVVHSYWTRWNSKVESKRYPGFQNAIELLEHCSQIGAGGVQVGVTGWTSDFVKKIRDRREKMGLYLEGSIALPKKPEEVASFEQDVKNAKEAGAQLLRTVCSGGRRYETFHALQEFQDFKKNALDWLQLAEPILRKYKMKLGIENHKDWLANELATILKQLDSEWIGVTFDFGNSIALLEDPMEVTQTLAPYVMSTHVKDMAVEEYSDGFLLSEVPMGQGILDLAGIVSICKKHNPKVTFNLEMITRDPLEIPCLRQEYWATFDNLSGKELARTLKMVRKQKYSSALPRVSGLNAEDKLALEEKNILQCLDFSKKKLSL